MIFTQEMFCMALLITVFAITVMNTDVIIGFFYKNTFVAESSVWCSKGSGDTNLCKFKNICYDPQFKTLLFFLNNKTIIKGIGHYTDLQRIQLSSVHSHSLFYANLSVIDSSKYQNKKQILEYQKVFLLARFKPNNLMHSIHDDLFPLFLTLEAACLGEIECMEKYQLIMFDHYPEGPYFELYQLFSNYPPLLLSGQMLNAYLLCFKEMLAGLIQDGIFFQYGFNEPQGPVKTNFLNQNDVHRFKMFITRKLEVKENDVNSLTIGLMSRMKNRKILNINQVEEFVKSVFQKLSKKVDIQIIHLNSSVNVIHLIKKISRVDVMIGMHGAEMILSIFMKPNSVVFELFPFGIQPDVVSFIKPLSESGNSEMAYFSWRNRNENHSVVHSDAHPLFGGIAHLDKAAQETIKRTLVVPPVKCCNDPLYLHHMYQDTFVSNEFEHFLYKSMLDFYSRQKETISQKIIKKWFFPYKINFVNCKFHSSDRHLNITWHPPFNVNSRHLNYKLYIKDKNGKFEKEFLTRELSVRSRVPIDIVPTFQVWISVHYSWNDSESPDVYVECP